MRVLLALHKYNFNMGASRAAIGHTACCTPWTHVRGNGEALRRHRAPCARTDLPHGHRPISNWGPRPNARHTGRESKRGACRNTLLCAATSRGRDRSQSGDRHRLVRDTSPGRSHPRPARLRHSTPRMARTTWRHRPPKRHIAAQPRAHRQQAISSFQPPNPCGHANDSMAPDACYLRHGRLQFSMTCG